MDIETIQQLIRADRYQVKLHALQHALQEGFDEADIKDAVLSGQTIEIYPERRRLLICGEFTPLPEMSMYLHVICEQTYPDQVTIVTAYIPSTRDWGTPPTKRKNRRR